MVLLRAILQRKKQKLQTKRDLKVDQNLKVSECLKIRDDRKAYSRR